MQSTLGRVAGGIWDIDGVSMLDGQVAEQSKAPKRKWEARTRRER